LTTVRDLYTIDGIVRVDMDYCPELDYSIGEMEVLSSERAPSRSTLINICERLSIDYRSAHPPGKVIMHLQKNFPLLFAEI